MILKTFIYTIFLSASISLSSQIIETDNFSTVLEHCDENTLLVCDVDNTLIESSQHLGSVSWKDYMLIKAENSGYTKKESEELQEKFWNFLQPFLRVHLVEDEIKDIVLQAKKKGTLVLAITERKVQEFCDTKKQLRSVHLAFSSFGKKKSENSLFYKKGILFSKSNKKGESLISFLQTIQKQPTKIVFIDDSSMNVYEVHSLLEKNTIPCVAIRYAKTDSQTGNFSPFIADLQWYALPKYLSNDDAFRLLKQKLKKET